MKKIRTNAQNVGAALALALICFGLPAVASAARFTVETVSQEGSVEAYVYFHPENETVNTLEGILRFPDSLLQLERIEDGRSIVQLWVERPKLLDGTVSFSGIIPGGFSGTILPDSDSLIRGLVLKAVFTPVREGESDITIEGAALRNDGTGTMLTVSSGTALVVTLPEREQRKTSSNDVLPPESFVPHVIESADIEGGAAVLVFQAADKQSGIAYYQVRERKPGILRWSTWHTSESPYLLRDQTRTSFIYVKAVDQAGNERTEILSPEHIPAWYDKGILELLLIIGTAILLAWYSRRRHS